MPRVSRPPTTTVLSARPTAARRTRRSRRPGRRRGRGRRRSRSRTAAARPGAGQPTFQVVTSAIRLPGPSNCSSVAAQRGLVDGAVGQDHALRLPEREVALACARWKSPMPGTMPSVAAWVNSCDVGCLKVPIEALPPAPVRADEEALRDGEAGVRRRRPAHRARLLRVGGRDRDQHAARRDAVAPVAAADELGDRRPVDGRQRRGKIGTRAATTAAGTAARARSPAQRAPGPRPAPAASRQRDSRQGEPHRQGAVDHRQAVEQGVRAGNSVRSPSRTTSGAE